MNDVDPPDSFRKRFSFKLTANVIAGVLGFVQAGLVSRALGPRLYGDFNFLSVFFAQFIAFLEMRTSTFLYTEVAGKGEKSRIAGFYFYVAIAVAALTLLVPLAAALGGFQHLIWPDQKTALIFSIAVLAISIWYTNLLAKLCDALALTVPLELSRTINRVILFIAVVLLVRLSLLHVNVYIGVLLIANVALMVGLGLVLRRTAMMQQQSLHPARAGLRDNFAKVVTYAHPIFVYTLMELIANYADRWLLQRFGGSIEQGLFSLAFNLGLGFYVIINALQPLVMREFSFALEANDLEHAANIFKKLIPACYALSAVVLCWAAVYADACVLMFGGSSYRDATPVFAIMAFLPVVHTYTILSGAALYAANRTRLLRNIGMFTNPASIAATFFLVAPASYGGLEMGATGLALKLVALEFIGANIVLYFNARMLHLRFRTFLIQQILTLAVLVSIAFAARQASALLLQDSGGLITHAVVGGLIYLAACIGLFLVLPSFAGVDRREVMSFVRQALRRRASVDASSTAVIE